MNQFHSYSNVTMALRQSKKTDMDLECDMEGFWFSGTSHCAEFPIEDFDVVPEMLPLRSVASLMKCRSFAASFDTTTPEVVPYDCLEVASDDNVWIDMLSLECDEMMANCAPSTTASDRCDDEGDKVMDLAAANVDNTTQAPVTPPRQSALRGKDLSLHRRWLHEQHHQVSDTEESPERVSSSKASLKVAPVKKEDTFEEKENVASTSTVPVKMEEDKVKSDPTNSFGRICKAPKLFAVENFRNKSTRKRRSTRKVSSSRTSSLGNKSDRSKKITAMKKRCPLETTKPTVVKVKAALKPKKITTPQKIEIDKLPDTGCKRIHDSQAVLWEQRFSELLEFKKEHGHACVPHWHKPNMQLSRWVKRQRYQFKLRKAGKPSTLTNDRIEALKNAGFVWDSHSNVWEDRYNELVAFQAKNGHCNITFDKTRTTCPHNAMASWIKHQRRQYKLSRMGVQSHMTQERVDKLNKIGFIWDVQHKRSTRGSKVREAMGNEHDI